MGETKAKDPFVQMMELEKEKSEKSVKTEIRESGNTEIQEYRNTEIQKAESERQKATFSLTKAQIKTIERIKYKLSLENDLDIEKSQIVGLGVEVLEKILGNIDIQKYRNTEILTSICMNAVKEVKK